MVKVIDFGLASKTPPDKLIGTPSYIAPEIIRRQKPDGRADLYSLGVLAYYALTGANPFRAQTKEETLQNHLDVVPLEPRQMNLSIPKYLSDIIYKLLAKDPDHRYKTPSDVIHDFNFRSTRFFAVETPDTLLSYVPWEGPFIGRENELEIYKNWLKDIEHDEKVGSLFWARGNIGSGKSRFIEECKNVAQLNAFKTILVDGLNEETLKKISTPEFDTVILFDAFDQLLSESPPDILAQLKEHLPHLNIMITTSKDQNSLETVRNFVENTESQLIKEIELTAFTLSELRSYIRDLTGISEIPSWLLKSLTAYTGGNPLFLTETMKAMIQEGILFDTAGRWKRSTLEDVGLDLSQLAIPELILCRLKEELEKLNDVERSILALLSVFDRPLSEETINAFISDEIHDALKHLKSIHLLRFDPTYSAYSFRHTIYRRATYLNLSTNLRRSWHDRVAEWLGEQNAAEEVLTYHRQHGTDSDIAEQLLIDEIRSRRIRELPMRLIDEFLERFGDKFDDDVMEAMMARARKKINVRNYNAAQSIYHEILDLLPELNKAPRQHFRIQLSLASLFRRQKKIKEAKQFLSEAEKILSMIDDPIANINFENQRANVLVAEGNLDEAIEIYSACREKAKDQGVEQKVRVNDLGHALLYKGCYGDAIDVLKEDIERHRLDGSSRLYRALYSIAQSYRHLGQFDNAALYFGQIIKRAKNSHDVDHLLSAYTGLGNVLSDNGKHDDSIGYYERAFDLAIHLGKHDDAIAVMINTGIVSSNMGDTRKAHDAFQTTLSFLERDDFPVRMRELYLCRTHLELGELFRIKTKFSKAGKHLTKALELAKTPQAKFYLFWVLLTEAKLSKDLKDTMKAKDYIKEARPLASSDDMQKLLIDTEDYMRK